MLLFLVTLKQTKRTVQAKKKKWWNNMTRIYNPFQTSTKREEELEESNRRMWKEENSKVQITNKTRSVLSIIWILNVQECLQEIEIGIAEKLAKRMKSKG